KPSRRALENGRLLGSAHTRSRLARAPSPSAAGARAAAAPRPPTSTGHTTPASAATSSTAMAANGRLEAEDIEHVPGVRVVLDVLHRADDAERGVRVVDRHGRIGDRAHPPADPGVDCDVLPAVRAEIRHRVADDPGAGLELPQLLPAARVHRLE